MISLGTLFCLDICLQLLGVDPLLRDAIAAAMILVTAGGIFCQHTSEGRQSRNGPRDSHGCGGEQANLGPRRRADGRAFKKELCLLWGRGWAHFKRKGKP